MSAMTRCPNCAHYWNAGDQRPTPAVARPDYLTVGVSTESTLAGLPVSSWLQQLLLQALPIVEPLVEKWVRDLLARVK